MLLPRIIIVNNNIDGVIRHKLNKGDVIYYEINYMP